MKLERLISITYALLNNEVISASELANKYRVSQRTIYRDIEAICAAGIPVVSFQGVNGGYGIIEEFKMEKSLLHSNDIESLITLLQSTTTVFQDDRATETLHRLQTIQSDKRPSLTMDLGSWRANNATLHALRAAITDRYVIRFEYMNSKNERATRVVEPVSLLFKYYSWYLHGYCRARNDYRVFKLTRMLDLVTLTELYHRIHPTPLQDISLDYQKEEIVGAVLHFSGRSLAHALDCFYAENKCFNEDGTLTVTITNPSEVEWLVEMILSFGEDVEVLEPLELRKMLKDKIEKMLNRYPQV
ncbi:YafY family transcriptional regulator [Paenibacillus aceris]|uniref:DNA-binding transcriptional regulator YafY n=2 Tax=Paenibacillus aceris TaxID=869555 RepID=A0ABS4HZJ9_9BACL|nr:YafY family protein [Paenibacillus aceris]MBP1964117.1 putative DNA-binding transcriptional regulator YafY [Paenibacillus aceris]NHW36450.1 YafY family transcriptional regulator [Paenibacillus aceris]